MTCKFGIDLTWIRELKVLLVRSAFENTLSASRPSPVQTIPCLFCLPASRGAQGLAWQSHQLFTNHHAPAEALRFSEDSENARSSLHATSGYECELLPLPRGGCGDLLLYGQMCLRRSSSHTSVDVCYTSSCLVWAHQCHKNRPAPYEISISY